MPHYKDGTEAKLMDIVKGKPYNTPHEVVGVVVGITPGSDTCNCRVLFTTAKTAGGGDDPKIPMQVYDHGELKAFEKVG